MRNRLPQCPAGVRLESARHLNFTRAGLERVTQPPSASRCACWKNSWAFSCSLPPAARAGSGPKRRPALPVLSDAFDRIEAVLQQFEGGHFHEVLIWWRGRHLLRRRLAGRGWRRSARRTAYTTAAGADPQQLGSICRPTRMDFAIRFGEGLWPATCNIAVRRAADGARPPAVAARLRTPQDLQHEQLMRTYRKDEWERWFAAAQVTPRINGPVFDPSS